jgi:HK97 family phage portal protein
LLVAWQRSAGNAYAYIDRQVFELVPIHPRRMTPQIKDGLLVYVLDNKQVYNADEVLHFRGLATDILGGMSVVDKAREALGLSISARDHQTNTLKNSARPNVLIKSPKIVPKIQRDNLLKEWQQMHQGGQNAGRTAILDNGLDVTPYAFTSQDMELMESQRFTVRDISNFTGVPAHKLGDSTRAGYNSIEAENLSFLADTLEAILVGIEQELEDKLLFEEEKISGSRQIMFDRSVLSGTDTNTKATYWRTALGGHPWATVAEARKALNLNHEDGTDFIPAPANMGQGGEQNRPTDPTGDFPKGLHLDGLKESTATALQSATQRLFRKLGNQAKAKAGKPGEFIALVDGLYGANVVGVLEDFLPLERAAGLAHGVDLAGKVGKQALRHAERQFKHVADTATAAGLPSAVEDVCRQFETFHLDNLPRA